MSNKKNPVVKTTKSEVETYSYAYAYVIQTEPLAKDESDVVTTNFISNDSSCGETAWACNAKLFDTLEDALAKLFSLKLPRKKCADGVVYPRVVRVELKCDIKPINDEVFELF